MADATYQPKLYDRNGGDQMVVASGGSINVEPGGVMLANGTQAAAIATTAVVTADAAGIASLQTNVNALIVACRGVGIVSS